MIFPAYSSGILFLIINECILKKTDLIRETYPERERDSTRLQLNKYLNDCSISESKPAVQNLLSVNNSFFMFVERNCQTNETKTHRPIAYICNRTHRRRILNHKIIQFHS